MMNRLKCLVAIFVCLSAPSLVAQDQVGTISPSKPKIGDDITITYNPAAKGAVLKESGDISAEVLVVKDADNMPQLAELSMKKDGAIWSSHFKLTDEKARVLLLHFVAGNQTDENGEKSWSTLVYGANGNSLEGANLILANVLRSGSYAGFKVTKDVDAAASALATERKLYPENYAAAFLQWSMMMRSAPGNETNAAIKVELERLYEKGKSREELIPQFAMWFEQLGEKAKADEIHAAAIAANPKGKAAEGFAMQAMQKERDIAKRTAALEKFLSDFPQTGQSKENYENMLTSYRLSALMTAKKYDEAVALVESMPKKNGMSYNDPAWYLIEKGEQLEKAVCWAKKGADLLRHPDPSTKPGSMSVRQWKQSNDQSLGMILDTYGFGLFQLGKTEEAEDAYQEAHVLTKGMDAEMNQRFVESSVKNGHYEKAIATAVESIKSGKSNDKVVEAYKAAYVKVNGSEKGFEDAIARAKESAKSDLKKDLLKDRVNKPAIDFALKSPEGKTVKLSELKGKVVVVDFWATWCGPCKSSFPYLQTVYEKYKSNPKVVILALDTWERVAGEEREALVKKFIADNKYTFPVLYDEGFVEKYGVDGIPTKFVIDKKGMIQFKTIGFTGEQMVDELTTQIEMLLDDNFYSLIR